MEDMTEDVIMLICEVEDLDKKDRVRLFDELKSKFCMNCGTDDPQCQCDNDE